MKIKNIIFIITVLIVIKMITQPIFDKRPIIFESYNTEQKFEAVIRDIFVNGSDLDKAVDILQDSKASCRIKVKNDLTGHLSHLHYMPEGAQFAIYCYYRPYFSLHPFSLYKVTLYADKNLKLIDSWSGITKY